MIVMGLCSDFASIILFDHSSQNPEQADYAHHNNKDKDTSDCDHTSDDFPDAKIFFEFLDLSKDKHFELYGWLDCHICESRFRCGNDMAYVVYWKTNEIPIINVGVRCVHLLFVVSTHNHHIHVFNARKVDLNFYQVEVLLV